MKRNRHSTAMISTIICLLPLILSFVLYDSLPENLPVHWHNGEADGYLPKAAAAFGLPVFFAAVNLLSHFSMGSEPNKENMSGRLKSIIIWIIPLGAVLLVPFTLLNAAGLGNIPFYEYIPMVVGVLFIAIGNYLPKCRQNYTMGIKLPWTLNSEINWNKTHRVAGHLWIAGGMVVLVCSFFKWNWLPVRVFVLALMIGIPFIYSYILYKKGVQS